MNLNILNQLNNLKANPIQLMAKFGYNIPQGCSPNDPESIVKGLINSGQVSQDALNGAMQFANQMGIKL